MRDPSRVRVSGPLEPFAAGFAALLLRQGYSPNSACSQMRLMAHLSGWLARIGLDLHALCLTQVERFLHARRAAGFTTCLTSRGMQPILTYLQSLGVTPVAEASVPYGAVETALQQYRDHLTIEQGLQEATARGYVDAVRPFLQDKVSADGLEVDFEQLNAADIIAFVLRRCGDQRRGRGGSTTSALRSLLRYLHVEGFIERPLAMAVPSVARRRLGGLPKTLEPAELAALLASCDRSTRTGRRDFAILTMLVRLGLRAGEVAALRLEDIDWRAGELVVRGKGNRADRLPLPTDVGEAISAYLRGGRPSTSEGRTVFVRVKAPHRRLSNSGVSQLVLSAGRRAGLGRIYPHCLRHTAATQMMGAGASLTEIGQVLRHQRTMTTAIYAKVDREALRTIARCWPGGGV